MTPIQELLQYHRPSHSRVQMDNGITRKTGCTPYGMFKQSLRELSQRWIGLRGAALDLMEVEQQLSEPDDEGLRPKHHKLRLQLRRETILEGMIATARETITFYEQAVALRAQLPTDLTDETIEQLELEYWHHWLKKQIALELEIQGRVNVGTLDLVVSMPQVIKEDLWAFLHNPAAARDFLLDGSVTALPKVERLGLTVHQVMEQVKQAKPLQLTQ